MTERGAEPPVPMFPGWRPSQRDDAGTHLLEQRRDRIGPPRSRGVGK